MKIWNLLLLICLHHSSIAQLSDSCLGSRLKSIDIYLQINGFSHEDSVYFKPEAFNDRIELKAQNAGVTILGFRILSNCSSCDILEYPVCGNKVPEKYVKMLSSFFRSKSGWLEFYDITILVNGRKYFAREFTVFPQE
jgi:hypothetical protein